MLVIGNLKPGFAVLASVFAAFCVYAQQHHVSNDSLTVVRDLMSQGQFVRAETLLHKALESSPKNAAAHFLMGNVLFHENRPTEALAEYTLGATFRTPGADELIGVASAYILIKDYADADHWLTKATQLAPENGEAWYLLGRTQFNENKIGDAEQSFQKCLLINSHSVKAEYNLGLAYENSQRPEMATEAYKNAIKWQGETAKKDPQPFLDLGVLLRHQGKVAEALEYLFLAEHAGPRNPMTLAEIALCYEQLHQPDMAVPKLRQALTLSPNVGALHFLLGRVYRSAGRADEAANEFAEAKKLAGAQASGGIPNEQLNPR